LRRRSIAQDAANDGGAIGEPVVPQTRCEGIVTGELGMPPTVAAPSDGGHGGAVEQCPEGTKLTKNDGRWKSSVVLELLPLKFSSWLDLACALLHPLLLLLG